MAAGVSQTLNIKSPLILLLCPSNTMYTPSSLNNLMLNRKSWRSWSNPNCFTSLVLAKVKRNILFNCDWYYDGMFNNLKYKIPNLCILLDLRGFCNSKSSYEIKNCRKISPWPLSGCEHIYIYVMYATREKDVSPRWRYASEDVDLYNRNSAHGHQPKGGRSCVDGARSTRDNTHGMFRHVPWRQRSRRRSQ